MKCQHCQQPPLPKAERPWHVVLCGEGGSWTHAYCSEACASHSAQYSLPMWRLRAKEA